MLLKILNEFLTIFLEQNNDYSDTVDFRRGWVGEVRVSHFLFWRSLITNPPMLIYLYTYILGDLGGDAKNEKFNSV